MGANVKLAYLTAGKLAGYLAPPNKKCFTMTDWFLWVGI